MPKEYVVTRHDQKRLEDNGGELPAVRVGWNAEHGWVQLATVLMQQTEGSTGETTARVDQGQFIDLDRDSINKLIKFLRRARDAAYGRDE